MAHVIFESSNLKSTIVGNIYDVLVNSTGAEGGTVEDIDNGVLVKVGDYTGNGLQERYAKKAVDGDVAAVIGTPALIKDAFTKAQGDATNFYNKAGKLAKAYELVPGDIFAVSADAFGSAAGSVAVGNAVKIGEDAPYAIGAGEGTGFAGKVHSISVGDNVKMVRILVVKNA